MDDRCRGSRLGSNAQPKRSIGQGGGCEFPNGSGRWLRRDKVTVNDDLKALLEARISQLNREGPDQDNGNRDSAFEDPPTRK
jgi:hypothetical protein